MEYGEYQEFVEYWNPEVSNKVKKSIPFKIIFATDKEAVANITQSYLSGRYSYFYLEHEDREIAEEIRREYSVIEESVCGYRGWNVYRITFEYR